MCNGCNGAPAPVLATGAGLVMDPRRDYAPRAVSVDQLGVATVAVPGVGTLSVPYRAPQPLPEVRILARPYPWAWILGGLALALYLTGKGK